MHSTIMKKIYLFLTLCLSLLVGSGVENVVEILDGADSGTTVATYSIVAALSAVPHQSSTCVASPFEASAETLPLTVMTLRSTFVE